MENRQQHNTPPFPPLIGEGLKVTPRFISVWFPYLLTDWLARRHPDLAKKPFVICDSDHGRIFVIATNIYAEQAGIVHGMDLPDARALEPSVQKIDHEPGRAEKLLGAMADWCLRYTPSVSVDPPAGIFLDVTGCAHLMGGEKKMLKDLLLRFRGFGYETHAALADTPGAAWATARYDHKKYIVPVGETRQALASLPPAALRLADDDAHTLSQLGINTNAQLFALPRATLTRRFGPGLCLRLDQALGECRENLNLRRPAPVYSERLNAPEGILTPEGIAIALQKLLDVLCRRLEADRKGLRALEFTLFRVDGHVESLSIGTGRPSRKPAHLMRLFAEKLDKIDPGLGLELFILSASHVEDMNPAQDGMFESEDGDRAALGELVDRLAARVGRKNIYRALPQASHVPERAVKLTESLDENPLAEWTKPLRPLHLLPSPEPIDVMAPVPDYPPLLFRRQGKLHRIRRADGPERIEPEWWIAKGTARDYYRLEDEDGNRYWIYRAGSYQPEKPSAWFLHGYFA